MRDNRSNSRPYLGYTLVFGLLALFVYSFFVNLPKPQPGNLEQSSLAPEENPKFSEVNFEKLNSLPAEEVSQAAKPQSMEVKDFEILANQMGLDVVVEQELDGSYSVGVSPQAVPQVIEPPLFSNTEWEVYETALFRSFNEGQEVLLSEEDSMVLEEWKSQP